MHCAKFGWNWPRGSGEKDENIKSLCQRRLQRQQKRYAADIFGSEKLIWAFGSGELNMKEKVSKLAQIPTLPITWKW